MTNPIRRIPRTSSSTGLYTREMIEKLKGVAPGETITYAEIDATIGVDVQDRRDLLQTARRHVRTLFQKEFDVIIDVGLVCLHEHEKANLAGRRRERTHRFTTVTIDILGTVDHAALTPLQAHHWLAETSIAAAVALTTTEQTVRELEAQPTPQPLLIDPRSYAGLFAGL